MDVALLRVLRDDGRISVARLAECVHISRASAYVRLQRLRRLGVLRGFSAVVDQARAGMDVTAVVLLTAGGRQRLRWKRLRDQLAKIPEVEYAALVTGNADVILLVRVRNQEELRRLLLERLQGLEHVSDTLTLMVLEEVVRRPYVLPEDP